MSSHQNYRIVSGTIKRAQYVFAKEYGFGLYLDIDIKKGDETFGKEFSQFIQSTLRLLQLAEQAGFDKTKPASYVDPKIFINKNCILHVFNEEGRLIEILREKS